MPYEFLLRLLRGNDPRKKLTVQLLFILFDFLIHYAICTAFCCEEPRLEKLSLLYLAGRRFEIHSLRCSGSLWMEHSFWPLLLFCSHIKWHVVLP